MEDILQLSTAPPPPATGPSLTSLVSGIVEDLQRLVHQEVELARTEVKHEWEKTKTVAASMAVGAILLALSAIPLIFFLVHLLEHYVTAIPLFGWFAIVGGCLALGGALLLGIGAAKASRLNVIPPQTAQTMRENVQWLQNQT